VPAGKYKWVRSVVKTCQRSNPDRRQRSSQLILASTYKVCSRERKKKEERERERERERGGGGGERERDISADSKSTKKAFHHGE